MPEKSQTQISKSWYSDLEKDGMIYTECMGTLHGKCQISFVLVDKDEQGKAASVMFTLRKIS